METTGQSHNLKQVRDRAHELSGIEVHALQVEVLPGKAWHQLSGELPMLSVVVRESGGCCEARPSLDDTEPSDRRFLRRRKGHASLIPAQSSIWGYSEDITRVEEVRLILDPNRVSEVMGDEVPAERLDQPSLMFFDGPLQILAGLIAFHAEDIGGFTLLGDSLVAAMIARLVSLQVLPISEQRRLGLSASHLRRVKDYIVENLPNQIRLAELSSLVRLSPSQFGRAFKISTGKTPHRWHVDLRIDQAMMLLRDRRKCLVEVALETGFSEQSHFTRTFRAVTGLSPSEWRRNLN